MTTQRLTEFYPERQGRPASNVSQDMESRFPSIPPGYISSIVNQILEDIMEEKLAEMVRILAALLEENKQIKLHLASLSNANIDEESARE